MLVCLLDAISCILFSCCTNPCVLFIFVCSNTIDDAELKQVALDIQLVEEKLLKLRQMVRCRKPVVVVLLF